MDKKIRVGAVSYLNAKPLVYGLQHGFKEEIDLIFDYPAKIAAMLVNDEIDVGMVPVAILPKLPEHFIISDYCIAASKAVASVCLFSDVPLHNIETILLDYQSRTSAALLKVLLKEHWKIQPQLQHTEAGFENSISGATAGLIIGDRALKQRNHSAYIYDLAEGWQEMTGLPFVFAAWVANKPLPGDFITAFNNATAEGFDHLEDIIEENAFPEYDLHHYYRENIDYLLDDQKRKALDLFLQKIKKL